MIFRAVVISLIIVVCASVLVYFNVFASMGMGENSIGIVNVVFGIVGIICGRLLLAEFSEYFKETGSDSKKVVTTRVMARKGEKIVLGNRSFAKSDVLISNEGFEDLQQGDTVRVEHSSKSSIIFSLIRVQEG